MDSFEALATEYATTSTAIRDQVTALTPLLTEGSPQSPSWCEAHRSPD